MDEASQVTEPLAIGPILRANKFIMLGDYYQLNPQIRSDVAEKKGMSVSLFEKLCKQHPMHCSILKTQYRMNTDIAKLANDSIYKGIMKIGS